MQMPYIKDILAAMGVRVLECEGFEADDILGTLSEKFGSGSDSCFILTGDRDSLQLITDNTTVLLHTNKDIIKYTPDRFKEDYGFEPINLIDLKGLMGDSSDNISGVRGIGEKTAMTLIQKYATVENVYSAVDDGTIDATKRVSEKLSEGREDAKQSKWLATIVRDAPIPPERSYYEDAKRDDEKLSQILSGLEMFRLNQLA